MKTIAAALAAVLVLAACDGDSTASGDRLSGEMDFTYSGDARGRFDAEGRLTATNFDDGTWAAGGLFADGQGEFVEIQAQVEDGGLLDFAELELADPAEGTVTCDDAADQCDFSAYIALGTSAQGEGGEFYRAAGGSVTITSLTESRIRGRFSLTLLEEFAANPDEIQVTGTFNVPLLEESDFDLNRAPRP